MTETRIWSRFSDWPRDGYQNGETFVFLAPAMLRIGKALYPSDWSNADPLAFDYGLLPMFEALATPTQKRRACLLLKSTFTASLGGQSQPLLTDVEWEQARVIAENRHPAASAAVARWAMVQDGVRMFLAQGLLPYVVRHENGSFSDPRDPAIWNTDDAELRFASCKMRSVAYGVPLPIFVPDGALQSLLRGVGHQLNSSEVIPRPAQMANPNCNHKPKWLQWSRKRRNRQKPSSARSKPKLWSPQSLAKRGRRTLVGRCSHWQTRCGRNGEAFQMGSLIARRSMMQYGRRQKNSSPP